MATRPAEAQRLRDFARLRSVRDRIERECAHPLNVEAVGCSSLSTVSMRFTELVGVPPSTYRRQAARAGEDADVRREEGDQTGQESRSAGHRAQLA